MKPLHWFLLLAAALAIAPKLAAVWVQRGMEVEEWRLAFIDCSSGLNTSLTAGGMCMDSMRMVVWREQERKRGKRAKRKI